MSRLSVFVELHPGPRVNAPSGPIDITDFCRSVSWGEGVESWVPITLDMSMERFRYSSEITPHPGDWIIVKTAQDGPAKAIGRVPGHSASMHSGGPGNARVLRMSSIVAESWLSFLGRVSVYMGEGLTRTQGTLLSLEAWNPILSSIGASLATDVGEGLAKLVKELVIVNMPKSLGSALMADAINVVHNSATAEAFTDGTRIYDPVPGPTVSALNSLGNPSGATVLGMLQGTFGADPGMIEFFPTLETGGNAVYSAAGTVRKSDAPVASAADEQAALASGGSGSLTYRGRQPEDTPVVKRHRNGQQYITTSRNPYLGGAEMVLNYRMRPWRSIPLTEYSSLIFGGRPREPVAGLFDSITWDVASARTVAVDHVTRMDWSFSDEHEVNATTASIAFDPDSPLRFFEKCGLPVYEDSESSDLIREEGLRLYQPNWPFIPSFRSLPKEQRPSYIQYLYTIALQAFQFHGRSSRFFSGSADLHYNPDVRCGSVVRIGVDGTMSAEGHAYVYADSVVHKVERLRDSKAISGRTVVNFSRGLFDENLRPTKAFFGAKR